MLLIINKAEKFKSDTSKQDNVVVRAGLRRCRAQLFSVKPAVCWVYLYSWE